MMKISFKICGPGSNEMLLFLVFIATRAVALLPGVHGFASPCCNSRIKQRQSTHFRSSLSSSSSSWNEDELFRRMDTLKQAEQALLFKDNDNINSNDNDHHRFLALPVITMDALLPGQRLEGSTTDPNFGSLLQRHVGLGGLLAMTSLNQKQRKLRRHGTICQVKVLDVPTSTTSQKNRLLSPTAVKFVLVGLRRCRVLGPQHDLKARTGRWRRDYDPDGEEARLGFGEERFVDAQAPEAATPLPDHLEHETVYYMAAEDAADAHAKDTAMDPKQRRQASEPSKLWLDCALRDADENDPSVHDFAKSTILPLLDEWYSLAHNAQTYENTNVVATARVARGQPGLRVDPAALLRQAQLDWTGTQQPPKDDDDDKEQESPQIPPSSPTALALYGAAMINPVPTPLGVAPEIRGRVLEAPCAMHRLQLLEWGLKRSLENLKGIAPL